MVVENGCISNICFLSFRVVFHWTMIMGERVIFIHLPKIGVSKTQAFSAFSSFKSPKDYDHFVRRWVDGNWLIRRLMKPGCIEKGPCKLRRGPFSEVQYTRPAKKFAAGWPQFAESEVTNFFLVDVPKNWDTLIKTGTLGYIISLDFFWLISLFFQANKIVVAYLHLQNFPGFEAKLGA